MTNDDDNEEEEGGRENLLSPAVIIPQPNPSIIATNTYKIIAYPAVINLSKRKKMSRKNFLKKKLFVERNNKNLSIRN